MRSEFEIHLPRKSKTTDVDSGKVLAESADVFTLQMEAQETRWLRLALGVLPAPIALKWLV